MKAFVIIRISYAASERAFSMVRSGGVNVNTSSFSYFPINMFSAEHVIFSNLTDFLKFVGILLATQVIISLAGFLR